MKNFQSFVRNVDDEEIIHISSADAFLNLFLLLIQILFNLLYILNLFF